MVKIHQLMMVNYSFFYIIYISICINVIILNVGYDRYLFKFIYIYIFANNINTYFILPSYKKINDYLPIQGGHECYPIYCTIQIKLDNLIHICNNSFC